MKIALVHDYLREFGGAERVLRVLSDMYPKAPIYTAFRIKNSRAGKAFVDKKIKESWLAPLLKLGKLYSPLRFLAPVVWRSMDLSDYDVVVTSASWYITRGFRVGKKTKVICYCHTPPRYLYGYKTSIEWQKYFLVRVYAVVVNHFLRIYDFWSTKTVDKWIVNSKNVGGRVKKFYKKDSEVIYPPVEVEKIRKASKGVEKKDFFLIVSRLVGAKGLEEAVRAANKLGFELKIVGEAAGFSGVEEKIKKLGGEKVRLLGRVSDKEIYKFYAQAKGFIALAQEEDFGMTVVEAMAAGTAVIAFRGGGFKESVIDGKTGIFIEAVDEKTIKEAVKRFSKIKWKKEEIQKWARNFSREKFEEKIRKVVARV
jgi:glycosyltransferase involved in cell wall biosynthesis